MPHLDPSGTIWQHRATFVPIWPNMGPYVPILAHMASSGTVCHHMGQYRPIWTQKAPYGHMWANLAHMDPYGRIINPCDIIWIYLPHVTDMTHVAPLLPDIDPHGPIWHHMPTHGFRCIGQYGPMWTQRAPYSHMWANMAHMDPYGPIMDACDIIWLYMAPYDRYDTYGVKFARYSPTWGPFGTICPHMASCFPYGFICHHMAS